MNPLAKSMQSLIAQEGAWDQALNPGQVTVGGVTLDVTAYPAPVQWEQQETGGWVQIQRVSFGIPITLLPAGLALGGKVTWHQADYTVTEVVKPGRLETDWTVRCSRRVKATGSP